MANPDSRLIPLAPDAECCGHLRRGLRQLDAKLLSLRVIVHDVTIMLTGDAVAIVSENR
jgi:hypothetical protein